ncbi:hypothetical protein C2I36_14305 [Rhodobacteraceae bacterium WD3A24]|nr:hypothetical protein C2I36_14305 [Rhodobacteraceae bacterium WD3A24]
MSDAAMNTQSRAAQRPPFSALGARIARYRDYRRTLNELRALSTRDLADLGLEPDAIKRIARQAAYGG